MFKFSIPLQKGIELQPYRNYPVPVVRTRVHVDKLAEKQNMQVLADEAQRIINKNQGVIQHWCNARRQEYSLSTSRADKKTYQLDQLILTHTILFDQEIIELDVYPDLGGKEEDKLCLMVIHSGNSVAAFEMASLGSGQFGPLYTGKFKSSAPFDEYEKLYVTQFKPTYANTVICSTVKFSGVPTIFANSPFLNAISGFAAISTAGGEFGLTNPVVVWSEENIYTPEGTYQLKGGSFELVEPTPYPGITPYAISMEGVYYYEPRIFTSYTYISLNTGYAFATSEAPAEHTQNVQNAFNALPPNRDDVMNTSIFDSETKTTVKFAYSTDTSEVTDLTFQAPLLTISEKGELGFELNTVNGYAHGVGNKPEGAMDVTTFSYLNESYSGSTPMNGPQKGGVWAFIPFPYALSNTEYYFATGLFVYSPYIYDKKIKTPYEVFEGANYDAVDFMGWLQLSNNTYLIQAFVIFPGDPLATVRIYCNGERIEDALADSLGITPNQINAVYMDIPLSIIKKF